MPVRIPLRWAAIGIFVLSNALNYLDRQLLPAVAPQVRQEFHLSNADYGWIISLFSIVYAASSPLAGLFIDRVGLNRGISIAVGAWSLTTIATGWVGGFVSLLLIRALLGVTQAGGIPGAGKASSLYLLPQERALGAALGQVGISLGGIAAPLVAGLLTAQYGWRHAFIVAGALGFLWIPLWLATARRVPAAGAASSTRRFEVAGMLRSRQYWGLVAAAVLGMFLYSLWTNWTTVFLVKVWNLSPDEANRRLAWIPPLAATAGGLLGGVMSLRLAKGGMAVQSARMRACWLAAGFLLATAAAPYMPGAGWAALAIGLSYFWSAWFSVNLYAMPLDLFGHERAAFAVSSLTFAYGMMQTFVSPLVGKVIDVAGFGPVCWVGAVLPLCAVAVLRLTEE